MTSQSPNADDSTRVLIVEDDEMQAAILQQGLASLGFRVDIVTDGLAAVEMVEDGHYDAVLVDYNIPEIDGLATARLLGDFLGPIARPVLIALTATPDALTARENGAQSAFDLVLDKTCDLASIVSAISGCLAAAPASAVREAARDSIYDRSEEDYVMGPPHGEASDADPGPVRILVVEDDWLNECFWRSCWSGVAMWLRRLPMVWRRCEVRENCCDLALVDYNLPEIDGLAVASLVHDQMSKAWRPRLIALTATPDVLCSRAMRSGPVFDQIVDKSSSLDELSARSIASSGVRLIRRRGGPWRTCCRCEPSRRSVI